MAVGEEVILEYSAILPVVAQKPSGT